MFGLLNINKPAGQTSRDVVNHVQRMIRPSKVGHAGTLDPLATGVLILCVGPATKLIQYIQRQPKRYTATFILGQGSNTDDVEGEIVALPDTRQPAEQEIASALCGFVGAIEQRPPAFSAIKVQGQRAYKLARAGAEVELPARTVMIHGIQLISYEYPELVLDIQCGSGTYVRSLGRDLAQQLGTRAVMSALVRTEIGRFQVTDAHSLDQITAAALPSLLLPAGQAVSNLPAVELDRQEVGKVANGMTIARTDHGIPAEAAAFDSSGQLVAIVVPRGPDGLRPSCNFAVAARSRPETAS